MASGVIAKSVQPQRATYSGTIDSSGYLITNIPSAGKTIVSTLTATTNMFSFAVRIGDTVDGYFRFIIYNATTLAKITNYACVIYIDYI